MHQSAEKVQFGKYRGKPWSEVPYWYLESLLSHGLEGKTGDYLRFLESAAAEAEKRNLEAAESGVTISKLHE